jgi:SagB-type dehydrogenase family enzyme
MSDTRLPLEPGAALDSLLRNRRSVRDYSGAAISRGALCRILASGQGVTSPDGNRAAPSAHALHPLTLHVVARRVRGLEPGLYAHQPASGQLLRAGPAVPDGTLLRASLADDTWLETAAAVIAIGADRQRAIRHFADQQPDGLRGLRYVDFEAGAVAQNMHLRTVSEGLGGVTVMGLDDQILASGLALPDAMETVALFCIGALPA